VAADPVPNPPSGRVRAALDCVGRVPTALLAWRFQFRAEEDLALSADADAFGPVLSILASAMLTVTAFSLTVPVNARGAASSGVTRRATTPWTGDRPAHDALATILGAFMFSVVEIIALSTPLYGPGGRPVLLGAMVVVIDLAVVVFLGWMRQLTRFGRVGETIRPVEQAASRARPRRHTAPAFHTAGRGRRGATRRPRRRTDRRGAELPARRSIGSPDDGRPTLRDGWIDGFDRHALRRHRPGFRGSRGRGRLRADPVVRTGARPIGGEPDRSADCGHAAPGRQHDQGRRCPRRPVDRTRLTAERHLVVDGRHGGRERRYRHGPEEGRAHQPARSSLPGVQAVERARSPREPGAALRVTTGRRPGSAQP
jgi:hypothetical protein